MPNRIYRETLVRCFGTLACGFGLHSLRRLFLQRAEIEKAIEIAPPSEKSAWQQLLRDLDERLILRPYDVDHTMAYALAKPPDGAPETWPTGTFISLSMPGPDFVQSIREGRLKNSDFHFLNVKAYEGLDGAGDASGGARINGAAAQAASRERTGREERWALQRFATRRREMADTRPGRFRVVDLMGFYGGVGTGAFPLAYERLADASAELGTEIEVQPFFVVPGTWPSKNPTNSGSLVHACLKEYQARISKLAWTRRRRAGFNKPTTVRETFPMAYLIEDANNAPGASRSLSEERLSAWLADLFYHLSFTPLGEHVRAKEGDFGVAAAKLTPAGEQLAGRTIGLSTIFLNRGCQRRYSQADLEVAVVGRWLQEVDHAVIQDEVRVFFESRGVVQGAGRNDLARRLWEGDGQENPDLLDRTMVHVRRALEGVSGLELLETAARRVADAVRTSGDRNAELAERDGEFRKSVLSEAERRLAQMRVNPMRGHGAAVHFVSTAVGVLENMEQAASRETSDHDARVQELRAALPEFDNYAAAVRERGAWHRWWYSDDIRAVETRARSVHEQLVREEFERDCHLQAIQSVLALREAFQEILSRLETQRQWLADCLADAEARWKCAVDEDSAFWCPLGLAFPSNEDELKDLNAHLVPDTDEAVRQFFSRLANPDPEEDDGQPEHLAERLERISESQKTLSEAVNAFAEETLRGPIDALHVIDELQRRYATPEPLKAVLRERDMEAHPRLRVRDSVELEHRPILVRLVGLDRSRGQLIEESLPGAVTAQSVPYAPVDTGDRDRISFLQLYAGFPISDWEGMPTARAAAEETAETATFEPYHVPSSQRFLPEPGRILTPVEVIVVAFEAFVLDRLDWDAQGGWTLLPGVETEGRIKLGPNFEAMYGQEGYRRAVDVITQFWCLHQEHGSGPVRDRLGVIARINSGDPPKNEAEKRLAPLVSGPVLEELERELEWVRINTVPSAQEWYAPPRPAAQWGAAAGQP